MAFADGRAVDGEKEGMINFNAFDPPKQLTAEEIIAMLENEFEEDVSAEEEDDDEVADLADLLLSTDLLGQPIGSNMEAKTPFEEWQEKQRAESDRERTKRALAKEAEDLAAAERALAEASFEQGCQGSMEGVIDARKQIDAALKRPKVKAASVDELQLIRTPTKDDHNVYYLEHWTIEDAAKQMKLTIEGACGAAEIWACKTSQRKFEAWLLTDWAVRSNVSALCRDLTHMARFLEACREGWDLGELFVGDLAPMTMMQGELVTHLKVLAGYKGCKVLEEHAVAPATKVHEFLKDREGSHVSQ